MYLTKSAILDTANITSCEPTASQTPAEVFGLSCCLAASQACCEQEIWSNNPCAELDHYLSDPLKYPDVDMLNFWMVLNIYFNIANIFINHWLYRIKALHILCSGWWHKIFSPFLHHQSLVRGHFLVWSTQTPIIETIFCQSTSVQSRSPRLICCTGGMWRWRKKRQWNRRNLSSGMSMHNPWLRCKYCSFCGPDSSDWSQ